MPAPWEPEAKLYLYKDGTGLWAVSPESSDPFYGDGLDLLKKVSKIETTVKALWTLESKGLRLDTRVSDSRLITDYEVLHSRREEFNKFCMKCNDRVRQREVNIEVASHLCTLPVDHPQWWAFCGQFLHSCSAKELEHYTGAQVRGVRGHVMFVPFYDLPGRPVGMRVYIYRGNRVKSFYLTFDRMHGTEVAHGGIAMGDTTRYDGNVVIAVDNMDLAFTVQQQRAKTAMSPLPLVVYNSKTDQWPILSQRVVFWAPARNMKAFVQARKIPNAAVTLELGSLSLEKVLMQHGDIHTWYSSVIRDAKPWMRAFKEYLVSLDVEHIDAALEEMQLTSVEKGQLLFECSPKERELINSSANFVEVEDCTYIGSTRIVERDNQWFSAQRNGSLSQVSNTTFRIKQSATFDKLGEFLVGELKHGDKTVEFFAPLGEISRNAGSWLRRWMIQNGVGVLRVVKSWESKLLDIALSFNDCAIEHIEGDAKVGWSKDLTKFQLPGLSVTGGGIDMTSKFFPMNGLAGENMDGTLVPRPILRKLLADTPFNRYFWALTALSLYNTTARFLKKPDRRVAVVGDSSFLELFCEAVGLSYEIVPGFVRSTQPKTMPDHDIPTGIQAVGEPSIVFKWAESIKSKNVIIPMSVFEAHTLMQPGWVMLPVQPGRWDRETTQNLQGLIPALIAQFQLLEGKKDMATLEATIATIKAYVAARFTNDDKPVSCEIIDDIQFVVRYDSMAGKELTDVERVMHYLFAMYVSGRVKLLTASRGRTASGKTILAAKSEMLVSRAVFQDHAGRGIGSLLTQVTPEFRKIIKADQDGVVHFKRAAWDAAFKAWEEKVRKFI